MRDYLQFVLLTGMRRREAASLQWKDIDLADRTFTVYDTKNGDPLTLPLSKYLVELLECRKAADSTTDGPFPVAEPKRAVSKVRELSGVNVDVHSLRRTFITVAESLDVSRYVLKKLVNHKSGADRNDVTSGYVVLDIERMRDPMQRITDFILQHAKEPTPVTPLKHKGDAA
jgi:integrase